MRKQSTNRVGFDVLRDENAKFKEQVGKVKLEAAAEKEKQKRVTEDCFKRIMAS